MNKIAIMISVIGAVAAIYFVIGQNYVTAGLNKSPENTTVENFPTITLQTPQKVSFDYVFNYYRIYYLHYWYQDCIKRTDVEIAQEYGYTTMQEVCDYWLDGNVEQFSWSESTAQQIKGKTLSFNEVVTFDAIARTEYLSKISEPITIQSPDNPEQRLHSKVCSTTIDTLNSLGSRGSTIATFKATFTPTAMAIDPVC